MLSKWGGKWSHRWWEAGSGCRGLAPDQSFFPLWATRSAMECSWCRDESWSKTGFPSGTLTLLAEQSTTNYLRLQLFSMTLHTPGPSLTKICGKVVVLTFCGTRTARWDSGVIRFVKEEDLSDYTLLSKRSKRYAILNWNIVGWK